MKCNYKNMTKRKKCPYYKVGYCKYKISFNAEENNADKCYLKEKK